MRIKRLEIAGFKSCKDRAVLDFPLGVTGVVGPNGCGKSNIVDALRWVLGEQSAKHLRGQTMEDVIFAGNERHGPLGVAEVTITFDNEAGLAHIREDDADDEPSMAAVLRGAPEVQITRRLFRSGESEYLINNRSCRLRDITELFLGTGVGTKAYSIIEQGRVGAIVSAKPEELRLFIEEAAGTTLFRSRKEAAERKIERTRDNLSRANDIIHELDRQAGTLRRQAKGAVRYTELREREEDLSKRLNAHKYRRYDLSGNELAEQLRQVMERTSALKAESVRQLSVRDSLRAEQDLAERAADERRRLLYEARGRVAELQQERGHLDRRLSELRRVRDEAQAECDTVEEGLCTRRGEVQGLQSEQVLLAERLERAESARAVAEREFAEVEAAIGALRPRVETEKSQITRLVARRAHLENEVSAIARQREGTEKLRLRLQDESHSLQDVASGLIGDVEACRGRLDQLLRELNEATQGKETAASALSLSLVQKAEVARRVEALRTEHAAVKSRFELLRELDQRLEGFGDGVRAFMSNGGRDRTGATAVLADLLEVTPGYEKAVAAMLQERLQYVVVPDADAGVAGSQYLRDTETGRAGFIPRAPRSLFRDVSEHVRMDLAPLSNYVSVPPEYREMLAHLFDGVVVVDSLESAAHHWKAEDSRVTYVTREGESLDPAGIITGGSGDPGQAGLLARKAELKELEIALCSAENNVQQADEAYNRAVRDTDSVAARLSTLDQKLHALTLCRVSSEGEAELHRQGLIRTEERLRNVDTDLRTNVEERRLLDERETSIRADLTDALEQLQRAEVCRDGLVAELAELEARHKDSLATVGSLRLEETALRERRETCEVRLQATKLAIGELAQRLEVLAGRLNRDSAELTATEKRLNDPVLSIEQAQRTCEGAQNDSAAADATAKDLRTEIEALERSLATINTEIDSIREQRARSELAMKEVEIQKKVVEDSVQERFGVGLDLLLGDVPAEDCDEGEIEVEIEDCRNAIRRLGSVNVGAVAELEEIESRLKELVGQRDDLERSIDDLRGTIARLNRMSRERFKETFDAVNGVFRDTFPRLFQGGDAWLALTDESNLLETGVEIFVRPPGKKVGNLNLLSGGEKALTAVSLIFSLFLYKPSPFCVLDEVDAPLDDANVGRFARMITEMSDRSQFVLITHNKRTMEGCDVLYGVTMQEPGISKIVSVQLT